jgi:DNA-binding response OmpR family regulator
MRDVTDDQIYIITSSYEVAKHTKAVNYGADTYGAFADDPSGDVAAGLALLDLQDKRSGRKNPKTPVLSVGGVILSHSCQLVFVNDVKIELQKKEFDVLEYLMQNNGYTVSSEDILQIVWGHTVITEDASDLVRGTVSRIRQKFAVASDKEYIITEAKKGYKMLS